MPRSAGWRSGPEGSGSTRIGSPLPVIAQGGNLAAACTLMARDRGGPFIQYQTLLYPTLDDDLETESYRAGTDPILTRAAMKEALGAFLPEGAGPQVGDFIPVAPAAKVPLILVAAKNMNVRSVGELVRAVKAKPGTYNFSSAGTGTSGHIAAQHFANVTGLEVTHVPCRGSTAGWRTSSRAGLPSSPTRPQSSASTSVPARSAGWPSCPTRQPQPCRTYPP